MQALQPDHRRCLSYRENFHLDVIGPIIEDVKMTWQLSNNLILESIFSK